MISQLGVQTTGGRQFFAASGTFTPSFTGTVRVSIVDGGQGSTGALGGQSGKAVFSLPIAVTQGSPVTVTCGAAGASGGGAGGASSFGAQTAAAGIAQVPPSGGQQGGTVPLFHPYGAGGVGQGSPQNGYPGAVLVEW